MFENLFYIFYNYIPYMLYVLQIGWEIIKTWWWLILPFLLWGPLKYHYLDFMQDRWSSKIKKILLEVKIPKEVAKPIRAMEQIFAGFHGALHDKPTWREKWIEGVKQLSFSFEIVSIEGKIHFYVRVPEEFRNSIESNIYSQYPDAEISVVDDYTKKVPQDIPNKDWNIWGVDFINSKNEIYPIKTYKEFEVETEKIEEKKIDPLSIFLEGMATLNPGEQMWLQIGAKPVLGKDNPWQERGRKFVDELAKQKLYPISKSVPKSMLQQAIEFLISGPPSEQKNSAPIPPLMERTPGEKEVIELIEKKLSKFGFDCFVRFIYLAKRDIFFKPRVKTVFSFFKEISTENLGGLKPSSITMTKKKSVFLWFLDKRRLYVRQRKMFRYYVKRFPPLHPISGMTFILNTEELATLFHFPSEATISTLAVSRVEVRKKEAPSDLPI